MDLEVILRYAHLAGYAIEHDGGGDVAIYGLDRGRYHGVVIHPDGAAYDLVTEQRVDPMVTLRLNRLVPGCSAA